MMDAFSEVNDEGDFQGYLMVTKVNEPDKYFMMSVTGSTEEGFYHTGSSEGRPSRVRRFDGQLKATGNAPTPSPKGVEEEVLIHFIYAGAEGTKGDQGNQGNAGPQGPPGDLDFVIGVNAHKINGFKLSDSDNNVAMRFIPYDCYLEQFIFTRTGSANTNWRIRCITGFNMEQGTPFGNNIGSDDTILLSGDHFGANFGGYTLATGQGYREESTKDWYMVTGDGTDTSNGNSFVDQNHWITGWNKNTPISGGSFLVFDLDVVSEHDSTQLNTLVLKFKRVTGYWGP